MKLKLIFGLILLSLFSLELNAQQKHTISGYVKNASNGESLIGARVYVNALQIGAITNVYGFYSLTIPEGEHEVLFSFVGFDVVKKGILLDDNIGVTLKIMGS